MKSLPPTIILILLLQNFLTAENWPAWRGKDATGSTGAGQYPSELNLQKNLQWKAPLPEKGCSTPIVWGDSILLTSPFQGQDAVLSFSMDGERKWQRKKGRKRGELSGVYAGAAQQCRRGMLPPPPPVPKGAPQLREARGDELRVGLSHLAGSSTSC